jgi:transcriptional regulator with XRE-family HTH domain
MCGGDREAPVYRDRWRRIRELRAAERQDDFAPELGITQGQLSKIERGVLAPSVDVLLRLRERFRKSVDWILSGE